MKKEQIIISMSRENADGFDGLTSNVYPSPSDTRQGILDMLRPDEEHCGAQAVLRSGDPGDIFRRKEGVLEYTLGDIVFHFHFLKTDAEYKVSDDEFFSALEGYANSNRSQKDFADMAARISGTMHRYIQNELWKFVRQIIRAFAFGRCDQRNRTAMNQALEIQTFIDNNPEF